MPTPDALAALTSLTRDQTALLVIDVQERLFPAMDEDMRDPHLDNVVRLLEGAGVLGLPVVATEQYPKGLGPTLEAVREAAPEGFEPQAKTCFSVMDADNGKAALEATGRKTVIVVGMETHICVYQTVLGLLADGYHVHVVADGCLSRTEDNWGLGLSLAERAGAVVTSTETVLFQLLGAAGSPEFKAISKLIR